MSQIGVVAFSEDHSVRLEQPGIPDVALVGPTGRSVCVDVLGFARPQDRQKDRSSDGQKTARRRDQGTFDKDRRRIGIIGIPPPEEGGWIVDGHSEQFKPRLSQLWLKAEPQSRPLCRGPGRGEHDQGHDDDLAPKDFRR